MAIDSKPTDSRPMEQEWRELARQTSREKEQELEEGKEEGKTKTTEKVPKPSQQARWNPNEERRRKVAAPGWKALCQLALAEPDPARLSRRISDARRAILERIEENSDKHPEGHEHEELRDAVNRLCALQEEYEGRVQRYGELRQRII